MTTITVTLDDQVNGERIQVNLDSTLPLYQVLDALARLRHLPPGPPDNPYIYDLVRVATDDVLRTDLSLSAQGVRPGEELILTRRSTGLDERSRILIALGAAGAVLLLCIVGVVGVTFLNASADDTVADTTLTPSLFPITTPTELVTTTPDPDETPAPTDETGGGDNGDQQTAIPPTEGCVDNLAFIADVSIPDGEVIEPGTVFTKTWRVQNVGTCDWTSDYLWVNVAGERMDGPNGQLLGQSVAAGTQVDISVSLRAPEEPGTYRGDWQMQNREGQRFGDINFVEIVVAEPTPTPLPDTQIVLDIDPPATEGPFDLISITATAERQVPAIIVRLTGEDDEGEDIILSTTTCEETNVCEVEYGGNDNEYIGRVRVLAVTCQTVEGCAEDPLGAVTGSFTISGDIAAPDQFVVSTFEADEETAGTYSVTLLWASVDSATRYEFGYRVPGEDPVVVDETNANTVSFTIEEIEDEDFPLTFFVRACNNFGCSQAATATQEALE